MQAAHDDNDIHFAETVDHTLPSDRLNEIKEDELEEAKPIKLPYYEGYLKELKAAVINFKKNHQGRTLSKFSNDFIKEVELLFQAVKQSDEHRKVRVVLGSTLWQKIADELQKYNVIQTYLTEVGPLMRAIKGINIKYTKDKLAAEDIFERDERLQEKSESITELESTIKRYKHSKQKKGNHNPDVFDYDGMKKNKEKYEKLYEDEKQKHKACQAREEELKEKVIALEKDKKSLEEDNDFLNKALEAKEVKQIADEAKAIIKRYAQEVDELERHAQKQAFINQKLEEKNSELEEKNSELEQKLSERAKKMDAMAVQVKEMDQKAQEESKRRLELLSELEHLKKVHNEEVVEKEHKILELTQQVNSLKEENEEISSKNNEYSLKNKVHEARLRSLDELVTKYEDVDKKLKAAEDELKVKAKTIDEKQFTIEALVKRVDTLELQAKHKKSSASNAEAGSAGQAHSYKNTATVFDFWQDSPSKATLSGISEHGLSGGANGNTTCARDIFKPTW